MAKHTKEMTAFFRDCADKLDAIRRTLPNETRIDYKFADFLTTAAREIREDVDRVTEEQARIRVERLH
jgi:hypothetical protein